MDLFKVLYRVLEKEIWGSLSPKKFPKVPCKELPNGGKFCGFSLEIPKKVTPYGGRLFTFGMETKSARFAIVTLFYESRTFRSQFPKVKR